MKLFSLALLPILSLPRLVVSDGAAINAAVQTISADAVAFNETLSTWTGQPLTILTILGESTTLLADINKGTHTAKASANLTTLELLGLVGLTQTLVADVQSTLKTLTAKKPVFAKTLTQLVALVNLKLEKKASDEFSAAVLEKVPDAFKAAAASITAPLDPAFDAAIKEFEHFF